MHKERKRMRVKNRVVSAQKRCDESLASSVVEFDRGTETTKKKRALMNHAPVAPKCARFPTRTRRTR